MNYLELYKARCRAARDTLRLTDQPLIDAGIVVWSLSGNGIGERERISRFGPYELPSPKKLPPRAQRRDYCSWLDKTRVSMRRRK